MFSLSGRRKVSLAEVVRPRRAIQAFLGLSGGIACAEFLSLPQPAFLLLTLAVGLCLMVVPSAWIVLLSFLIGWWHYTGWRSVPYEQPPSQARLRAIGTLEPTRNGWRLLCAFEQPRLEGYALVYFRPTVENPPDYGDEFLLKASWRRPRNWQDAPFDWARYLQRQRVQHIATVFRAEQFESVRSASEVWQRRFVEARRTLRRHLQTHLSREHSAIVEGMMMGATGDFPPELREHFMRSGIGHLLSTSGLHVAMVLQMVGGLLLWFCVPFRWRIGAMVAFAWLYTLLAGLRPSIVRASIMATLYLNVPLVRREADSLSALAVAGVLWLLVAPYALFEVGFQYSFGAVLFILLFYNRLHRQLVEMGEWLFHRTRMRRFGTQFLCPLLSVTLCAQAGIALIQLYHFGHLSLLSPIANLLAVPLAYPTLAVGLFFWASQGMGVLPLTWLCEWLSIIATTFGGDWVPALRIGGIPAWAVVLFYGAVILFAREPTVAVEEDL